MSVSTPETNMALLRRGYEILQGGDLDAAAALLTDDFIANLPVLPEPLRGREIWKAGAQVMLDGFPDLRIEVEDMFGVGDKVAVRVRFHGTHLGAFEGVPASGRQVDFRSIEIYRLEGDKIAEEWVSPDMMGLMHQISAQPDNA
jgi:steroid delta-isomerase-like uncharacterized protein